MNADPLEPSNTTPPEGWDAWAEEFIEQEAVRAAAPKVFGFIPAAQFLGAIAAPDWTIRDIVEADSLVVIFGDPESGKSFLAMDWAASVATGRDWNGFKVKQGPVLYINGEGRNGVNRRFTAWAIANQCPLLESPLFMSTMTTALTDEISRAEIEAVIAEFVRTHGQPRLVIIDTLARNFGPGDENSTQDMTVAVATCDAIRELTRATVALVHHSGHGDKTRARGSMVLRGAVDAEYRMAKLANDDTTFEATKMKDAAKPAPMSFRFASVELGVQDEEGREVTSAVLKRTEYQAIDEIGLPGTGRPKGGGKNQEKALSILDRLHAAQARAAAREGRELNQGYISVEKWRDECMAADVPRNRFGEAMAALKRSGQVRIDCGFAIPSDAF